MGFFKKRDRTIDFTKVAGNAVLPVKQDLKMSGDCVDLSASSVQSSASAQTPNSPMDFLNTMATSTSSSGSSSVGTTDFNSNELLEIKKQIRNTFGRVEDNSNELYRMLQRIELLEKKIERLEGR